jgi:hypothetical protein
MSVQKRIGTCRITEEVIYEMKQHKVPAYNIQQQLASELLMDLMTDAYLMESPDAFMMFLDTARDSTFKPH